MAPPAYRFWLKDLETIRRPEPLLNPVLERREVITVTIAPREAARTVTGVGSEDQPQDLDEDSEPRAVKSGTQNAPITFDDESESEGRETEEDPLEFEESSEPPEPFIHSDSIEEEMGVRGGGVTRAMAARVVRWRDYEYEGAPLVDQRVFRKEQETNDPYFESKIPRKPVTGKVVRREVRVASTDAIGKPKFSPEDAHFPYTLVGPGVKDIEARGKMFLNEYRRPRKGKGKAKGKKGKAKNTPPARKTIKKTAPKRVTAKAKDAKPPPSPPRRIMTRSRARAAAIDAAHSGERMTLRGGSGRSTPEEEESPSFYGASDTDDESIRFQDRTTNMGEIPSSHPLSSHRLHLDKLFDYMGLERISRKLDPHCLPPHHTDFETHLQETYLKDVFRDDSLIKGLPLMEDVVFLKAGNWREPGNCYWRCIAYLIYGTPGAWARVKAEHKAHFSSVLRNSGQGDPGTSNPRRGAYEHFNNKFYDVDVLHPDKSMRMKLNLFQILHVPYAWVPASMLEVTADVYGVFLMMYDVRQKADPNDKTKSIREVQSVKTAGTYNARHLFVYFNGSHYQPMTPNEFYGWEFQSPRVTAKATKEYEGSMIIPIPRTPRKGRKEAADGIAHPWRRVEYGEKAAPPVPVDHLWRPGVVLSIR